MAVKKSLGITHDIAVCKDCGWTSENDVYADSPDKAAKDHVKFFKDHKVLRETVTAIHYFKENK